MAGYIFAIGAHNEKEVRDIISKSASQGIYSPRVMLNNTHPLAFEGTFCDFLSMKAGDNVYFFAKRKVYGIGKLANVGKDCKYCNYKKASNLEAYTYEKIQDDLLVDYGKESPDYRWICCFKSDPCFFETGIDIDEILTYKPERFKVFRTFWNLSFIKIDEEENDTLKEVILLKKQKEMMAKKELFAFDDGYQKTIQTRISDDYKLDVKSLLASAVEKGKVKHEMALEAATIDALGKESTLTSLLGPWDYISHQVAASPCKPVAYMDHIDVFAMRYLPGSTIVGKYLVVELKKGKAEKKDIDQIMKYTDWVCHEYAFGNYEAITSCLIASDFPPDISSYSSKVATRYYTSGSHPVENKDWHDMHLLRYRWEKGNITYDSFA